MRASWDYLYSTKRWRRVRLRQLRAHPLCKFCLERGLVEPAVIVDHVEPHRGDISKFWYGELQSLCEPCHKVTKRFVEAHGFRPDIGLDGWPLDARHPVYRTHGLADSDGGQSNAEP